MDARHLITELEGGGMKMHAMRRLYNSMLGSPGGGVTGSDFIKQLEAGAGEKMLDLRRTYNALRGGAGMPSGRARQLQQQAGDTIPDPGDPPDTRQRGGEEKDQQQQDDQQQQQDDQQQQQDDQQQQQDDQQQQQDDQHQQQDDQHQQQDEDDGGAAAGGSGEFTDPDGPLDLRKDGTNRQDNRSYFVSDPTGASKLTAGGKRKKRSLFSW